MSEIKKFTGLVLKKLDFGDSSKIVTFFSGELGKVTGIIKAGRSSKSKIGALVDVLNETEIVIYSKAGRDIQLISQAHLVNSFPNLKQNLESIKYASSILELLDYFIMENDHHERLYKGTIRILKLINENAGEALIYFIKYLIFFLEEVGFGLNFEECSICKKELSAGEKGYNFELGFLCSDCKVDHLVSFNLTKELFDDLLCLSSKDKNKSYLINNLNKLLNMLERILMFNSPDFPGIQSLKVFS